MQIGGIKIITENGRAREIEMPFGLDSCGVKVYGVLRFIEFENSLVVSTIWNLLKRL